MTLDLIHLSDGAHSVTVDASPITPGGLTTQLAPSRAEGDFVIRPLDPTLDVVFKLMFTRG